MLTKSSDHVPVDQSIAIVAASLASANSARSSNAIVRMALRAVRSWLGLSRGGGWMVSLGLFCSAVLWVVCAVGLLDTQGTLVQRTFASAARRVLREAFPNR